MEFATTAVVETEAALTSVWQIVGLGEEVLQFLVQFRVLWKGGRLMVKEECRDQPGFWTIFSLHPCGFGASSNSATPGG